MPIHIALLRAVNVGRHNRVKMDELRRVCEELGFVGVRSYAQTGNLLLPVQDQAPALDEPGPDRAGAIAQRLELGFAERLGIETRAIMRSPAELRQALDANPFRGPDFDPRKLLVLFLAAVPKGTLPSTNGERLHLVGRDLFAYYPEGLGRSKLTAARLERSLGAVGTGRNLASLQALWELAHSLA